MQQDRGRLVLQLDKCRIEQDFEYCMLMIRWNVSGPKFAPVFSVLLSVAPEYDLEGF